MTDPEERQKLERELSGLQGSHANLRSLIDELKRKPELSDRDEHQLAGLENELDGLETRMVEITDRL